MEFIGAAIKTAGHVVVGAKAIRKLTGAGESESLDSLHNGFRMGRPHEHAQQMQDVAGQTAATPAGSADGGGLSDTDVTSLSDSDGGGILETVGEVVHHIFDWLSNL
jgi:hypothetical protein